MPDSDIFRILVINPGSTTTRLSFFKNDTQVFHHTYSHSNQELIIYRRVADQSQFRMKLILQFFKENCIDFGSLDAVAARGGLLKPIKSGVYRVNDRMREDLMMARYGEHASNLGAILAWDIARRAECPAYIVDPVVVDEMDDVACISGLPEIRRRSVFHALNQKSAAREVASEIGKSYEDCNFIVVHMGGGISVGAHRKGRVIDVNNALDGDGPFSPERSGGLPAGQLVELCFSGKYMKKEILSKITGKGGLVAYRGSNSFSDLKEAVAKGDKEASLLYDALIYQISQEICKHGATLKGEVDRIVLTGGLAQDRSFIEGIRDRVGHLAVVEVVPGEREMFSLARSVFAVLKKEEGEKEYL